MKNSLLLELPNGEVVDLLDDSPNSMEYICEVYGDFEIPTSQLLEEYKQETDKKRKHQIARQIRKQAEFFASAIGDFDEELQQLISWSELAERVYKTLMEFAKS